MTQTMIKRPPRDYQLSATRLTIARLVNSPTGQRLYYALPTGTGKTRVITMLVEEMLLHGRVLILAHRKELVEQTYASVNEDISDVFAGVVMASRNDCDAQVVCATVQTLESETRLQEYLNASPDPIYAIIIDESHHCVPGSSYERIISACQVRYPGVHVVGCTATPYRNDKAKMQEVLTSCVFERTIKQMQACGVLAPLRWKSIQLPVDFSTIKTGIVQGEKDYKVSALYDTLSPHTAFIVSETAPHFGSRPVCVFASSVAHAYELRDGFRAYGLTAEGIDANTPTLEREAILTAWKRGDIQVVANCAILTEGFDFSPIAPYRNGLGVLVIAAPTLSPSRYLQMVGRGTRLKPIGSDFDNCLVFDLGGNANLLDTKQITLPKLLQSAVPEHEDDREWLDFRGDDESEKEQKEKKPRSFKIRDGLDISWVSWGHSPKNDIYYAGLGTSIYACVFPEKESGLYHSYLFIDSQDQKTKKRTRTIEAVTDEAKPFREVMHHINHVIAQSGRKSLVDKNAVWRSDPASAGQLLALEKFSKETAKDARLYQWNKGEVAQSLNWYIMLPTIKELWKTRS